jgi:hypothetical protein
LVAENALSDWNGAPRTFPDDEGDYGRACAVDGYLGLIDVGGSEALVLGDHPAITTFLPDLNVLVRAIAIDVDVDVDVDVRALVAGLLPTAQWDERLHWDVTEPVILFDSVYNADEISEEQHLRIGLAPGRYDVQAAYAETPEAYLILVQLTQQ